MCSTRSIRFSRRSYKLEDSNRTNVRNAVLSRTFLQATVGSDRSNGSTIFGIRDTFVRGYVHVFTHACKI